MKIFAIILLILANHVFAKNLCVGLDLSAARDFDEQFEESPLFLARVLSDLDRPQHKNYLQYALLGSLGDEAPECFEGTKNFETIFSRVDFLKVDPQGRHLIDRLSEVDLEDLGLKSFLHKIKNSDQNALDSAYSEFESQGRKTKNLLKDLRPQNLSRIMLETLEKGEATEDLLNYDVKTRFRAYIASRRELLLRLEKYARNRFAYSSLRGNEIEFDKEMLKILASYDVMAPFKTSTDIKEVIVEIARQNLPQDRKLEVVFGIVAGLQSIPLGSSMSEVSSSFEALNLLVQMKAEIKKKVAVYKKAEKKFVDERQSLIKRTGDFMNEKVMIDLAVAKHTLHDDITAGPEGDQRYTDLKKRMRSFRSQLKQFNALYTQIEKFDKSYKETRSSLVADAFKEYYLELSATTYTQSFNPTLNLKSKFLEQTQSFLKRIDNLTHEADFTEKFMGLAQNISGKNAGYLVPQFVQLARDAIKSTSSSSIAAYAEKVRVIDSETTILSQEVRSPKGICLWNCGKKKKDPFRALQGIANKVADPIQTVTSMGHDIAKSAKKITDSDPITAAVNGVKKTVDSVTAPIAGIVEPVQTLVKKVGEFTEKAIIQNTAEAISDVAVAVSRPDLLVQNTIKAVEVLNNQVSTTLKAVTNEVVSGVGNGLHHGVEFLGQGIENAVRESLRGAVNIYNVAGDASQDAKVLSAKAIKASIKIAKLMSLIQPLEERVSFVKKITSRFESLALTANDFYFDSTSGKTFYKVDTYRNVFNGYKDVLRETVVDLKDIEDKALKAIAEKAVARFSDDLADAMNKYVEYTDKGVSITDAATSFENVSRAGLIYVGSVLGGPAGSALGNVLADRFIDKKNLTEKQLLESFAISMAGGYAAQYAQSYGPVYSSVARNLTTQLATAGLHGDDIKDRALAENILAGIVNGTATNFDTKVAADAVSGSVNYIIANELNDRPVDFDGAITAAMTSSINGEVQRRVESALEAPAQQLKKDLAEKIADFKSALNIMLLSAKELQDMKNEIERLTKEDIEAFGTNETKQNGGRSPDLVPALIMVGSALYELHGFYEESLKNNPAYVEFVQYVKSHGLDAAEASGKFKALLNDNDLHRAVLQKTAETIIYSAAGAGLGKVLSKMGPGIVEVVKEMTTGMKGTLRPEVVKKYFGLVSDLGLKTKDEVIDLLQVTKRLKITGTKRIEHFGEYLKSYAKDETGSIGRGIKEATKELGENGFILVDEGSVIRRVKLKPRTDPDWGLTNTHLEKHFFGESKFALAKIDLHGNPDKWKNHLAELFNSPVSSLTPNGKLDIMKEFPKSDGSGMFKMGIRLSENADGTFDLITVLTRQ